MKASRLMMAAGAITRDLRDIVRRQRWYAYSCLLFIALFGMTSCDDHVSEDITWHSWRPGMVYCTNGQVTTFEKCMEEGYTPEAVLFYVDMAGEIEGMAYAVGLEETAWDSFSRPDTTYMVQGTSADYTACDGETNTVSMRYGNIPSPLSLRLPPRYFIPSVGEYYRLFVARDAVNSTIALCGGDSLPVSDSRCWYWTSTECEGAERDRAWRFSLFSGRFESEDKHTMLPVRPVLMIRLNDKEK